MNKTQIFEERLDNFKKATNREHPAYVPVMAHPAPGVIDYAGTTLRDVIEDETQCVNALLKVFDDLYCDVTISYGYAYLPHAKDTFGKAQNVLGPDGITIEHLQESLMEDSEYPELIRNPDAFVSDVLLKRKYPEIFTENMDSVKEKMKMVLLDFFNAYISVPDQLTRRLETYYGVPTINDGALMTFNPLDIIFDSFRGFTGTVKDLRRHKKEVHEAIDVLWNTRCSHHDNVGDYPYACQWPHIPAYMNRKQFEEFYWPYEKQLIENLAKNGNKLYMLAEGKWIQLLDYFREVPKDSVIIHCDDDDVIKVSKKIGDYQIIAGGANLARTKIADKQTNIDHAKRVIDECAGTGAFVFCIDKNWTCAGDVNQTLLDVYQFAHEYGRY